MTIQYKPLLELADLLEGKHPDYEIPKKSFNMSDWFVGLDENDKPKCGTQACALGWAVLTIPWFKKKYRVEEEMIYARETNPHTKEPKSRWIPLGLTLDEFEFLFVPDGIHSTTPPKYVNNAKACGQRIRAWVEMRKAKENFEKTMEKVS